MENAKVAKYDVNGRIPANTGNDIQPVDCRVFHMTKS